MFKLSVCIIVACSQRWCCSSSSSGRGQLAVVQQGREEGGGAVAPNTVLSVVKESCYYAVPSALYMLDNNLLYFILLYLDPATLSLVHTAHSAFTNQRLPSPHD